MGENLNKPTKEDYNNIPVHFCKHCLSLRIIGTDGLEYCDDCGSTDMAESHISDWEELYELRYNNNFLNPKSDE